MASIKRRSIKWLLSVAAVCAATVGWSSLLWPPVKFYYEKPGIGFWGSISELLKLPSNEIFPDGFAVGYLFFISTFIILFFNFLIFIRIVGYMIKYIENSEVDVSLIETNLTYRFEDRLSRVIATRNQIFHANSKNITAYHYNQTVESESAIIDSSTFEMDSILNDSRITEDFIIRSSKKNFEAIEIFKISLPTSWISTYFPDWLVLFMWNHSKILDKIIVDRRGHIEIKNEHDGEDATIELRSLKRVAKRVTLTLDFPQDLAPRSPDIKCFIIRDNVVVSIHPRSETNGTRRVYSAFLAELDRASIRFQWNNRRLHAGPQTASVDLASARPAANRTGVTMVLSRILSAIRGG
ncbi:hypothetical protein EEB18_001220 [Sphingopyxis sp. OPL5]|uniref:hypothetical protein n=1 Tax=Sphingopyxis sp. OPL5 TaxID=2486273 RepID=UPI00164D5063|nr:hypothetical protein [Sphingopyxis sp. OPL5]QNO27646.1 hypothetical protein EEB18_001220 [Sphingopyxis sp. OPL5]